MDFFNMSSNTQENKTDSLESFSFENTEHQEKGSVDELTQLSKLAQRQLELIELLNLKFKEAKILSTELNELRLKTIPEFMEGIGENGINDITVKDSDGNLFPINIKKEWTASLTKVKKPLALKWLADNDFGDLVKKTISFTCDASSDGDEEFQKIKEILVENNLMNFETDEKVHVGTLKSFIKEQVDNGNDQLDLDLFSAFQIKQSVIDKVKIPDFKKVK